MQIELIINEYLKKCKLGKLTFRQACHNIDIDSKKYKLVFFEEKQAIFEANYKNTKRRFKIHNNEVQ